MREEVGGDERRWVVMRGEVVMREEVGGGGW